MENTQTKIIPKWSTKLWNDMEASKHELEFGDEMLSTDLLNIVEQHDTLVVTSEAGETVQITIHDTRKPEIVLKFTNWEPLGKNKKDWKNGYPEGDCVVHHLGELNGFNYDY